jgi:hypothetical protein
MGRIRLRASWKKELTDADSRSTKTVVDEKYKNTTPVVPVEPCSLLAEADCSASTAYSCEFSATANTCGPKVISGDKCPTFIGKKDDCLNDKTCGYDSAIGICAKLTGCAANLDATACGKDTTCEFKSAKCSTKPPPVCNLLASETTCAARDDCAWDAAKCGSKVKQCTYYTSKSTCNSLFEAIKTGSTEQFNKCTWTDFLCAAKPVVKVAVTPCGSFLGEPTCAKDRCAWKAPSGNDKSV